MEEKFGVTIDALRKKYDEMTSLAEEKWYNEAVGGDCQFALKCGFDVSIEMKTIGSQTYWESSMERSLRYPGWTFVSVLDGTYWTVNECDLFWASDQDDPDYIRYEETGEISQDYIDAELRENHRIYFRDFDDIVEEIIDLIKENETNNCE